VRWKKNKGGQKRTIEEAVEIAKRNGVEIPDDVEFFEADPGDLKGSLRGLFRVIDLKRQEGPLFAHEAMVGSIWKTITTETERSRSRFIQTS
jgi:hypothetical protein